MVVWSGSYVEVNEMISEWNGRCFCMKGSYIEVNGGKMLAIEGENVEKMKRDCGGVV